MGPPDPLPTVPLPPRLDSRACEHLAEHRPLRRRPSRGREEIAFLVHAQVVGTEMQDLCGKELLQLGRADTRSRRNWS